MRSGVVADRHGHVHGDVQVGSHRNVHCHAFEGNQYPIAGKNFSPVVFLEVPLEVLAAAMRIG